MESNMDKEPIYMQTKTLMPVGGFSVKSKEKEPTHTVEAE